MFSPKYKKSNKIIKIKMNDFEIEEAQVVKYLGVLIDKTTNCLGKQMFSKLI